MASAAEGTSEPQRIWLFLGVSEESGREGFLRVVNHSDQGGTVRIEAVDDAGAPAGSDCQGGDSIWMSPAKGSKLRRFQVRMADAPALSAAVAIRASYICPPRTPRRWALRTASQVS